MKKSTIMLILILSILLIGCGSSSGNKILRIIELNRTTRDNVSSLNLEMEEYETWNEETGIYEYNYIWDYADYTLNNVEGTIRIRFEDNTAKFVNYSAEATSENMNQLLSYLVDTYGDDYEEVEDYTTRWVSGNLIIDYVLTDDNTIEIRWYKFETNK